MRLHSNAGRRLTRLLAGVALGALSMAWAGAALAADEISTVEEVVVTAQKKSEKLQEVPASVSVVTATDMTKQGLVSFADYSAQIPGLSLTSSHAGQAQVTLRGITTGPAQSASATSFYLDEAPIGSVNAYTGGSSTTPDLDPSDLARVEVLKGPQGTLYGAGSVGGLLKFVTVAPNYSDFTGRLSVGGSQAQGGANGYSVRGLVNLPIIQDRLVVRASAFSRVDPAFIDNVAGPNDVNAAKVRGGRLVIAARPRSNWEIIASFTGQDTHSSGFNTMDVTVPSQAPIYGDLKQRRFTPEITEVNLRLYNVTNKVSLGDWNLVSSTTYQTVGVNGQADGTLTYGALLGGLFHIANLGVRTHQNTRVERFSEEVRGDRTVLDGKLDLQLGLYYTHESDSNRVPSFDPFLTTTGAAVALPNIVTASIISRYTETSFFANGAWHFTPRFDVIGGLRYSVDDQNYYQDYAGLIVGAHRINVGRESGRIITYQLSPRFRITPDMMVYGRVATGYRPGGPNAVPPPSVIIAPNTFAPDKLTSYEVGYKAAYLGHTLVVDAALFYTDWQDIQVQTSAGGFNYFVNGGTARSQGGELTVRYTPIRGLNLGLNSAYTDARLTAPAVAAGGVDGDRLPFVPRWSGSITADYQWNLTGDIDAFVGGSVNYVGERISNFSGKAPQTVPSYTTVNLRAGLNYDDWTLSVYGKNIGDERGIVSLSSETLTPASNPFSASVIQPRVIGAELSVKF